MDLLFLTTFLEVCLFILMVAVWALALWLFIWAFADIFRRRDLSGWGKAGWILLIFIVPWIGVLIYLCTRPAEAPGY